jgi:glycosyltransferase involved in cell wall biosynthesis
MDPQRVEADVTLLLEGTYPFVRGGVSSWVHDLITGLPELTFSLVYLGAEKRVGETRRYELPPNVRSLYCHYLMDSRPAIVPKACAGDPAYFAAIAQLHEWFRDPEDEPEDALFDCAVLQTGRDDRTCSAEFFYSEAAWSAITESYSRSCPETSLLSYFWAVRNTHGPLIKLAGIARSIPSSRIFHAVSTGYAGLLGAMLSRLTRRPLILTEHGIYSKERKIDLQSMFLQDRQGRFDTASATGMEHHEHLWLRMFEGIGHLAYAAADPIISLYEQNRQRQIRDGANPMRTRVIPNGVNVERFAPLRALRPEKVPLVLGLIGRIVPIKDIKTFIRTIRLLVSSMPEAEGWLIGPEEEDPAYVSECKELVRSLQLENNIKFLGFQRIEDVLPRLGLLVLTSISEAFPLVIGESYASGLPVLTTDVGACRDLIEGREDVDRALGSGGTVVPIVDPDAMARAAFALLSDPVRWHAAQKAGIQRVERYYRQVHVIASYREIYQTTGKM